jgi:PhnB protein
MPRSCSGRLARERREYLNSGAIDISATDWMASPEHEPIRGNMTAIFLQSESLDELRAAFERLAEGASEVRLQELHELPFGTTASSRTRSGSIGSS